MEAKELRDAVATGIKSLTGHYRLMTGERGVELRPEYLTTAVICFSLANSFEKMKLAEEVRIRSEELTRSIWNKVATRFRLWARNEAPKRSDLMLKRESARKGNVDISLFMGSAFELPFGVIENKGVLRFNQQGDLYVGSRAEVEKDLRRNAEFVLHSAATGGVEYSAFTFYVEDDSSALEDHGREFRAGKRNYFEKELQALGLDASLRVNVWIDTLDDDLYESEEKARETDEHGAPAIDLHPPWHLVFGVISIYRVGRNVTDEELLHTEANPDLRAIQ